MRADDAALESFLRASPKSQKNEDILSKLKQITSSDEDLTAMTLGIGKSEEADKKKEKLEDLIKEEIAEPSSTKNTLLFERFFGKKTPEFRTFEYKDQCTYSSDYTWRFHGLSLLSNHFPELANQINEKYLYLTNMTTKSFGEALGVNTKPYRIAIYHYTEYIHGYFHSEYEYKEVNNLLHKDLKAYIKAVACMPQSITTTTLSKVPVELKPFEICHIALLVMQAKFHIELMYGLLSLEKGL
jgi:sestrin